MQPVQVEVYKATNSQQQQLLLFIIWLFDSIVTQDICIQASMHSLGGETYQLIILFDTEHTIILHLNCWLVGCGPDSS
jgi:hypothetical protein